MKQNPLLLCARRLACGLGVWLALAAVLPAPALSPQEFSALYEQARGGSAAAAAQLQLARCYEQGDAVEKNALRALAWYSTAASYGSEEALEWLQLRNKGLKFKKSVLKCRKLTGEERADKSRELVELLTAYKNESMRAMTSTRKGKKPASPLKAVAALLREGADPNMAVAASAGSSERVSAMSVAAELGQVKLNDVLLSNGGTFMLDWRNALLGIMYRMGVAERRLASAGSRAPSSVEAELKKEATSLRYMLAREYDARMLDTNGNTLLHRAALLESARSIEILVKAGANVNQPNVPQEACNAQSSWVDHQARTPLFAAIDMGAVPCVEQLLALGADVHYADKQGMTPAAWAEQCLERSRTSNIPEEVRADTVKKHERCLELIRAAR